MNSKAIATAVLIALIAAGSFVFAQQQTTSPSKPALDPRLDKIIEQNTQILKGQADLEKKMDDMKEGLLQLRRRSS